MAKLPAYRIKQSGENTLSIEGNGKSIVSGDYKEILPFLWAKNITAREEVPVCAK